jgi:uncharacterized ion transporter superfamily protein YfcC
MGQIPVQAENFKVILNFFHSSAEGVAVVTLPTAYPLQVTADEYQ